MEGPAALGGAVEAGWEISDVFLEEETSAHSSIEGLAEKAAATGAKLHRVSASVMKAVAETPAPQGIVAIVKERPASLDDLSDDADLVLALVEVRDPGNAGTLVRSAVAARADAVVFSEGSVDPFGGRALRAAVGATFQAPIVSDVSVQDTLSTLRKKRFLLVGGDAAATSTPEDVDLTARVALVVGNEAHGLAPEVSDQLDKTVRIPMPGPVESLNVAVAGSILLFEIVKQRRDAARLSSGAHFVNGRGE